MFLKIQKIKSLVNSKVLKLQPIKYLQERVCLLVFLQTGRVDDDTLHQHNVICNSALLFTKYVYKTQHDVCEIVEICLQNVTAHHFGSNGNKVKLSVRYFSVTNREPCTNDIQTAMSKKLLGIDSKFQQKKHFSPVQ